MDASENDLVAIIIIRGRKGEPQADVSIDFRPTMNEDGIWEASGAGEAVMVCLEALRMVADSNEIVPEKVH